MNDEIKKIRKYISCPQFGDDHYGEWGALRLEQRIKIKSLLDYITNLQQENQTLQENNQAMQEEMARTWQKYDDYKSRCEKAVEYITSYEAISTIQGLDNIEQNKTLDERTMNVMVERYLQVHHNLLNILQNGSEEK